MGHLEKLLVGVPAPQIRYPRAFVPAGGKRRAQLFWVLIGVATLKLNEDSDLLSPVRRRECCSKPLQCTWGVLIWALSHDGWNSLFNGAYWAIQEDGVLFLNLSRYAGVCFQKFILPPCSNSWSTKPTWAWPQVDEGEAVKPWVPSWTDCSEGQCIWVRQEI